MFSHEPFVVLFYLLAQIHDDCWQQACFARSWKFISLSYVAKKNAQERIPSTVGLEAYTRPTLRSSFGSFIQPSGSRAKFNKPIMIHNCMVEVNTPATVSRAVYQSAFFNLLLFRPRLHLRPCNGMPPLFLKYRTPSYILPCLRSSQNDA